MSQEHVELVLRGIDAWNRGDIDVVYDLKEGQVSDIRFYLDPAEALEAAGLGQGRSDPTSAARAPRPQALS